MFPVAHSRIIVRMLIRAIVKGVLIASLMLSSLTAQLTTHFEIEGEAGSIRTSEDGVIQWPAAEGIPSVSLESGLRRLKMAAQVGSGRRFLVAGYRPKERGSEVLLIELQDEPRRIEVLSRRRVEFEIDSLGYRAKDQQLYLYDDRRMAIHSVDFHPGDIELPLLTAFKEIIDATKFSVLPRTPFSKFGCSADDWSDGFLGFRLLSGSYHPGEEHYFIEFRSGRWQAFFTSDVFAREWGPGAPIVSARGTLECFVPSPRYRLMRTGGKGGPQEILRGDHPEEKSYSQVLSPIDLPSEGLVPGGRYIIARVAGDPVLEHDPWAREFIALERVGEVFEPGLLRIGLHTTGGRSRLGNRQFTVRMRFGTAKPYGNHEIMVHLLWALPEEDGSAPLQQFGKYSLLTAPLGSLSERLTFSTPRFLEHVFALPLTDSRMQESQLIYFQGLAVDGKSMALSEVFATTLFPSPSTPIEKMVRSGASAKLSSEARHARERAQQALKLTVGK